METIWGKFLNRKNERTMADRIPQFHQQQQQPTRTVDFPPFGYWNQIASLHATNTCHISTHQQTLSILIPAEGDHDTLSYTSDYHSGWSSDFNGSHPSNSPNGSSIALSTPGFDDGQRRASLEFPFSLLIRPPYPDYVCHDCDGELGHHWRKDCPKHQDRTIHTSYQGNLRSIAWFNCLCGKQWKSRNAWSESTQQCEMCHRNVWPRKMKPHPKI